MSDSNDGYEPSTYGDRIADAYDDFYQHAPGFEEVSQPVEFLAPLAGGGPALELGIGTGRIALPLQAAGVRVHGIDASAAMVERMRAKPGGDDVQVTIGDFSDFSLDDRYPLIYVPFNTFFALLTQDDQVTCFRAVARHLAPGGVFVIEAFVPDLSRFDRGQRVSAVRVDPDWVSLDVSLNDPVEQFVRSQHVVIREGEIHLYPVLVRYAYVAELDLMARMTGLRLRERWADWERTPFTSSSQKHISVWERDPDAAAEGTR
ncbi:MAG: class I SAM-dependent methyltransferase [Actinomycetota bacterium]